MPTLIQRQNRRAAKWGRSVLVLSSVAIAGCTGGGGGDDVVTSTSLAGNTTTTIVERSNDGTLRLGVYLPQTGEGAQLGVPMIEAVQQAVATINDAGGVLGQDIEINIVDESGGTGPDALLSDGVDAIVGPASSRVALAQLGEIVQPATGVVTCSPTATALLLDGFPDRGLFFRTVPSDSLQMAAIARLVEDTGESVIAVGYLDDPYGRGLAASFAEEVVRQGLEVGAEVGFGGDQEDLSGVVAELVADSPGVIVVLGDADDGSRLLAAIDGVASTSLRRVFVNDDIRDARQAIQSLSPGFRQRIIGVAPNARSLTDEGPDGFFTAHAVDCVNLIALATIVAGSDDPASIKADVGQVASGGRVCLSFDACVSLLDQGLQIDYSGYSGSVDLSNSAGDPIRAWFETFGFDSDGIETGSRVFEVP